MNKYFVKSKKKKKKKKKNATMLFFKKNRSFQKNANLIANKNKKCNSESVDI